MDFRTAYKLSFEISPIILTGGIAPATTGGMLPIVAITQLADFTKGLLNGDISLNLDNFFAHFHVLPGGTLINNQIGKYPFANQVVAANAIIAQPLNVSLKMTCPANGRSGMVSKILTMEALQIALQKHNSQGGTYAICTPSFIYTGCIMTAMTDISGEDGTQKQREWKLDFEQPLTAISDAVGVQNNLMKKITDGIKTNNPIWSDPASPSIGGTIPSSIVGNNVGGISPGIFLTPGAQATSFSGGAF